MSLLKIKQYNSFVDAQRDYKKLRKKIDTIANTKIEGKLNSISKFNSQLKEYSKCKLVLNNLLASLKHGYLEHANYKKFDRLHEKLVDQAQDLSSFLERRISETNGSLHTTVGQLIKDDAPKHLIQQLDKIFSKLKINDGSINYEIKETFQEECLYITVATSSLVDKDNFSHNNYGLTFVFDKRYVNLKIVRANSAQQVNKWVLKSTPYLPRNKIEKKIKSILISDNFLVT